LTEPPPLISFRLPRGRHRLPRELVAENQRWRLLAAASEVLAANGYARTTSAEIAKRAGVSRSTFYQQFPNVEACLLAAHETAAASVLEVISACREGEDAGERLDRAIGDALDFLSREPSLAKLLGTEVSAGVPAIATARDQLVDRLTEKLRAGRAARGVAGDAESGVECRLVGGAVAIVAEAIDAGEAERLPELSAELSRLLGAPYASLSL
jgi:TetR/AcrR family transcriptional regulator